MRTFYRKKSNCQNCQYPLLDNYNFCPNCGQENSDKLVPFSTLVTEFFGNLIGYDSKLSRSIKPFLFKPGYLTNEFIAGRRTTYVHPLRLYFTVTFFYFFALTLVYKPDTNSAATDTQAQTSGTSAEKNDADFPQGINVTLDPDSLEREKKDEVTIFSKDFSLDFLRDKRTTEAQVVDSLGWKQTTVNRYIVRQVIKFTRSDAKSLGAYFTEYMLSKASILMFFMLPIFALLLKLFYIRRKRFYVEHITFSLHFHAFAFLILLFMLIVDKLWVNEWIATIAFLIIVIYGVVSARNVYKQGWVKTIIKGFLLFIPYTLCFGLLAMITIIIGGLFY